MAFHTNLCANSSRMLSGYVAVAAVDQWCCRRQHVAPILHGTHMKTSSEITRLNQPYSDLVQIIGIIQQHLSLCCHVVCYGSTVFVFQRVQIEVIRLNICYFSAMATSSFMSR